MKEAEKSYMKKATTCQINLTDFSELFQINMN